MTILYNISRNSTHYLLWVGREESQQGLITLWKYTLKIFWCLDQADEKDVPGIDRFSWILYFIDHLSKAFPISARRLEHFLYLFSDENLSRYQYEDFLRILFYAAAPTFIVCIYNQFEYFRDRGVEEGRGGERLFASMSERLLHWYWIYKWITVPYFLIQMVTVEPESSWFLSAFDIWLESNIVESIFAIWTFLVWKVALSWLGV